PVGRPVAPDLVLRPPEPDGEAGRVCGAQRGRLGDARAHYGYAEDVRLELHEQFVAHHAAVDLERRRREAAVGVHRVDHLAGLERRGLQHRAGYVAAVDVTGQPDQDPTRLRAPVRREQPGERRDEVRATVVVHGAGQRLDLGGGRDQPEVVA